MSLEEVMDGQVPGSPVFSQITTVPPFMVELSITKAEKLPSDIGKCVEDYEESCYPVYGRKGGEPYKLIRIRKTPSCSKGYLGSLGQPQIPA